MNRDQLIQQVKREYAAIAARQSGDHVVQSTAEPTPEAFFEALLSEVIGRIEAGEFDRCASGAEVVRIVANGGDATGCTDPSQNLRFLSPFFHRSLNLCLVSSRPGRIS